MKKHRDSTADASVERDLARRAVAGEAAALEELLVRLQPWVLRLATYILQSRADAEDATQEILVKVATRLASFEGASAVRTWVYRVAVNHLLDCKRSRAEGSVTGFECYARYLESATDSDPDGLATSQADVALLVEEARLSCTLGMLLCLDRRQRLVFVLGELLEVSDGVGAELAGVTRANFRQLLSRAREQLSSFMRERCGLVDPRSPCRCARKTAAFVRDGIVDPARLQFAPAHLARARRMATRVSRELGHLPGIEASRALYPEAVAGDPSASVRAALARPELRALLGLESQH
jgi:RNA polymerase sigma factor (sigma-70 family)